MVSDHVSGDVHRDPDSSPHSEHLNMADRLYSTCDPTTEGGDNE